MLVSGVQPVTTLRALFWVVCSFWRLVSDMIGYQTVLAYSMTDDWEDYFLVCG